MWYSHWCIQVGSVTAKGVLAREVFRPRAYRDESVNTKMLLRIKGLVLRVY